MKSVLISVAVVLGAVVAASTMRAVYADASGFGPSDLERFEARAYGVDLPDHYGDTPFWLTWSRGDGQAYVTLAADPLAQDEVRDLGVALYRFSRVGYAWAALALIAGQFHLIPIGLFAINIFSLAILSWIAVRRMPQWGPRALTLVVVPGVLISVVTDTAEALGMALAAIALVANPVRSRLAAVALGLVRPDFATVFFLRGRKGALLVALTAVGAIAIRLFGFGLGLDYTGLNGNLTLPLLGYIETLPHQPLEFQAITLGLVYVAVVTVARGIWRELGWMRLAPIGTGIFVLMLAPVVLDNPFNSLRAASALALIWAIPAGVDPSSDADSAVR